MGGIKDMSSPPPHVKTWGEYIPPIPPGFTPLCSMHNYASAPIRGCMPGARRGKGMGARRGGMDMGTGRGGGQRRPSPSSPPRKKICTNKILTCKWPSSYVMRGTFTSKVPYIMH